MGRLFESCYQAASGVVFEKNPLRAEFLARQRPHWIVYEANCKLAIEAGFVADLPISVIDVDPFGAPWGVLAAWFLSHRNKQPRLDVVVNDGLRLRLKLNTAWSTIGLEAEVGRYGGKAVYDKYLEVSREKIEELAKPCGYTLREFTGYYCGHNKDMTHWWAQFTMG